MSVWNDANYQTDCLCAVLRSVTILDVAHPIFKRLANQVYEGNQCVGDQFPRGVVSESLVKYRMCAKVLEPRAGTKVPRNVVEWLDFLDKGDIVTGIQACYDIVHEISRSDRTLKYPKKFKQKAAEEFVMRMITTNGYASYKSPKHVQTVSDEWRNDSTWKKKMFVYEHFGLTFLALQTVFNNRSERERNKTAELKQEVPNPTLLIDFGQQWELRKFGAVTVLTRKHLLKDVHYLLTIKDLRRVTQMTQSLADMEMYFGLYRLHNPTSTIYSQYVKISEIILQAMKASNKPNHVARACDVASNLYLSELATDVWQQSVLDQQAKIEKEGLDEVIDFKKLMMYFKQVRPAEAIELTKVYKFLPCPDFNLFTAMEDQRVKHAEVNDAFYDNRLHLTEHDFVSYQKYNMQVAHYLKHGRCYGFNSRKMDAWEIQFPYIDPRPIHYKRMFAVHETTFFQYEEIALNNNFLVKDKTLAPRNLANINNEVQLNDLGEKQRSYLMYYLTNADLQTPTEIMKNGSIPKNENHHLVAMKPESKKPIPRNFYIAPYNTRVTISELEMNIARYLENRPGNYNGINFVKSFNNFIELYGTEFEKMSKEYISVSFDISGFSPKLNPKLRRMQLAKWARAFNKPELAIIDQYFTEGTLKFIKKGFCQEYKLHGNDLEGYLGRMNTDLHLDIMGYCIRKLRDERMLNQGAKLAVMIDDGLCIMQFPKDTENASIVKTIKTLEEMYKWFGLNISWDKTYVSRHLNVFLNEIYYQDRRISPGVKAFLRIRKDREESMRVPLREINKLYSMTSGAIGAGTHADIAYVKYAFELYKVITSWLGYDMPRLKACADELVLFAYTPVAYGGCGAISQFQLISNASDSSLATSLGILKAIAKHEPRFLEVINKILSQEIAVKTPLAICRDATTYRIVGNTLTDTKEYPYAKQALETIAVNPYVREACEYSEHELTTYLATFIDQLTQVSNKGLALRMAYEASPLKIVDDIISKFSRANTLCALIGYTKALHIHISYRKEFVRCLEQCLQINREF